MTAEEQITDRLQKLPQPLQREVLDFIDFLAQRVAQREDASEEAEWTRFSLVLLTERKRAEPFRTSSGGAAEKN